MVCALILIDTQTGRNGPFWGARNTSQTVQIRDAAVAYLHGEFVDAKITDAIIGAAI